MEFRQRVWQAIHMYAKLNEIGGFKRALSEVMPRAIYVKGEGYNINTLYRCLSTMRNIGEIEISMPSIFGHPDNKDPYFIRFQEGNEHAIAVLLSDERLIGEDKVNTALRILGANNTDTLERKVFGYRFGTYLDSQGNVVVPYRSKYEN